VTTERISLQFWNPQQAHAVIGSQLWPWLKANLQAGNRMVLLAHKEKRSDAQNRMMWACLTDISEQVEWFGKRMEPESWKEFITGHLNGQELVPNMDGTGFISIGKGRSTSQMTRKEVGAVIDLCHAFGADKGVQWSPTSLGRDAESVDPDTGEIS
jgi:hypothetical protein